MKLTLLEYVQDILNDMDSDEVESIFDTTESEQVAQIVKSTYYALMSNRNWPHQKQKIQLEATDPTGHPVRLKLPDNVKELVLVNYDSAKSTDTRKKYVQLRWLDNDEFLRRSNHLNDSATNVETVVDNTGVEIFIRNDIAPTVFTSFDDVHLVFDAYNNNVETHVDPDKMQAIAYVIPEWEHDDTFTPDLPMEAVTSLLEEAKSRAMFKLKQVVDPTSERESRRQRQWLSRKAWKAQGGLKYPNYGRRQKK